MAGDRTERPSPASQLSSRRGPRRRRPAKLHGDKGCDYDHLRRWLRQRGRHRIARKRIESSRRLGRHRWTIERTMAWLAGCRRLHRRYERKAVHFLASPASPAPSFAAADSPNEMTSWFRTARGDCPVCRSGEGSRSSPRGKRSRRPRRRRGPRAAQAKAGRRPRSGSRVRRSSRRRRPGPGW